MNICLGEYQAFLCSTTVLGRDCCYTNIGPVQMAAMCLSSSSSPVSGVCQQVCVGSCLVQ